MKPAPAWVNQPLTHGDAGDECVQMSEAIAMVFCFLRSDTAGIEAILDGTASVADVLWHLATLASVIGGFLLGVNDLAVPVISMQNQWDQTTRAQAHLANALMAEPVLTMQVSETVLWTVALPLAKTIADLLRTYRPGDYKQLLSQMSCAPSPLGVISVLDKALKN